MTRISSSLPAPTLGMTNGIWPVIILGIILWGSPQHSGLLSGPHTPIPLAATNILLLEFKTSSFFSNFIQNMWLIPSIQSTLPVLSVLRLRFSTKQVLLDLDILAPFQDPAFATSISTTSRPLLIQSPMNKSKLMLKSMMVIGYTFTGTWLLALGLLRSALYSILVFCLSHRSTEDKSESHILSVWSLIITSLRMELSQSPFPHLMETWSPTESRARLKGSHLMFTVLFGLPRG